MKRGNIFGVNTTSDNALEMIVKQICRVLQDPRNDPQKIQIQIKYAQFKYLSPSHYHQYLMRLPQGQQKKQLPMVTFIQNQRYFLKDSLKKMSYQNIISLNQLGRPVYGLNSCFNQQKYQKFYHMRDFLLKQCQFNKNLLQKKILLPQYPKNIYHQYSLMGDNNTFKLIQSNQLRFDFIFKDSSSQLQGRYSYSPNKGWIKTKKTQLIKQQIDIMLSQKTYRIAINHQEENFVSYQQLYQLKEQLIKRKFKFVDIRLKKTMKCTKSDIIQYSLSQVYQPKKVSFNIANFDDLAQFITQDSNILDKYLLQKFQYFYKHRKPQQLMDTTNSQARYQIQSQFTKMGIKTLKQYLQKRQHRNVHYQIEQAIHALYNLFYADHSVRSNQAVWMDKIMSHKTEEKNLFKDQRLTNQFGNYMHNILYEEMTIKKNNISNNI